MRKEIYFYMPTLDKSLLFIILNWTTPGHSGIHTWIESMFLLLFTSCSSFCPSFDQGLNTFSAFIILWYKSPRQAWWCSSQPLHPKCIVLWYCIRNGLSGFKLFLNQNFSSSSVIAWAAYCLLPFPCFLKFFTFSLKYFLLLSSPCLKWYVPMVSLSSSQSSGKKMLWKSLAFMFCLLITHHHFQAFILLWVYFHSILSPVYFNICTTNQGYPPLS